MPTKTAKVRSRNVSLLVWIAWLSILMLITGLFIRIGGEMNNLWIIAGLFGLTAAVGLSESLKSELRSQQKLLDNYLAEARSDPLTGVANRCAFDCVQYFVGHQVVLVGLPRG